MRVNNWTELHIRVVLWSHVGLFSQNKGLFLEYARLFWNFRTPHLRGTMITCAVTYSYMSVSHTLIYVSLAQSPCALSHYKIGLFLQYIGLFSQYIGLFSQYIGLFSLYLGLFYST